MRTAMTDKVEQTDDPVDETVDEDVQDTTAEKTDDLDKAFAEQRRKARAAERKARDLEKRIAEMERKEAEADGRWQEIAEEERKARETLEREITERDQREAITQAASSLRFKNPQLAYRLLSGDEVTDTQQAEQALKRLAKQEPYLIEDPPVKTGAAVSGAQPTDDPMTNIGIGILDAIQRQKGQG